MRRRLTRALRRRYSVGGHVIPASAGKAQVAGWVHGAVIYWPTDKVTGHVAMCTRAPAWWERLPIIRRIRQPHVTMVTTKDLQ